MADISVEYYLTEKRQRELIDAARHGMPASSIRQAVREAVAIERERCARVVEKGLGETNTTIARKIRNGDGL